MNKFFLSLCCLVTFTVNAQRSKPTPAVTIREAKTGKAVVLEDNGANGIYANIIDSGGALLFEYNYTAPQMAEVADDEYKEIVGFNVIPDKTGRFELKGDALKTASGYFYKGCFCMDRGTFPIVDGTIRGTKMSKTTWYINADVKVSIKKGEYTSVVTKKIKGIFTIIPAP